MNRKTYLAVDIGGTEIKWALIDEELQIIKQGRSANNIKSTAKMVDAIEQLAKENQDCGGIGISVPGTVKMDDPDGTVYGGGNCYFLDRAPLGKQVRERCQLPVAVLNDGKCGVLGEYEAGVLKGVSSGVVLALGTGVGGGIIINGSILEGFHSFAGEFSFLSTNTEKPFSISSAVGGVCGWPALKNDVLTAMNKKDSAGINGYTIFQWIEEGNKDAQKGLDTYAFRIAQLIMQLQSVVDPECFVIAGGISARPALLKAIQNQLDAIRKAIRFSQIPAPTVKAAALGNDANLVGAAAFLLKQLS